MSYLFGSILTVPHNELILVLILDIIILLTVGLFHDQFTMVAFDEEFAQVIGISTRFYNGLLLCLIALTVVVMIRAVGIILVIALLTIPPSIAGQYTRSMGSMMGLSILLGVFLPPEDYIYPTCLICLRAPPSYYWREPGFFFHCC